MVLTINSVQTSSVFRLNGADENSATRALGWALERSLAFRRLFMEGVLGRDVACDDAAISLQKHGDDGGYTDLQIERGNVFHAILEAKLGWTIPTEAQLLKYCPRFSASHKDLRLVSVSAANREYAKQRLPAQVAGVNVVHLSWGDVQALARRAIGRARAFEERVWLRELVGHLTEFVSMRRSDDNRVYVVSLSNQPMIERQPKTWIDVVERDACYFHPVGNGWPVHPPSYVGFRYYGRLQSVRRVESFTVVRDLSLSHATWPHSDSDHFVYRLGPPMLPRVEVRTGNIFRSGRVWCAIDTLLSGAFATISDARDETQRRERENA